MILSPKTDINGMVNEVKNNKVWQLLLLIIMCIIAYWIVSKYIPSKNNFNNIQYNVLLGKTNGQCKGDIPKIDEAIIRNMIDLPNRNPKFLTSKLRVKLIENTLDKSAIALLDYVSKLDHV